MASRHRIDLFGPPFTTCADELSIEEFRSHFDDVQAEVHEYLVLAEPPNSNIVGRAFPMLNDRLNQLRESLLARETGERFVKQPDGRFARFSETRHDFLEMNLPRDQAVDLATGEHDTDRGPRMIAYADIPDASKVAERWQSKLDEVWKHVGAARVREILAAAELRTPAHP